MSTMLLDPVDELTRRRLLGGASALGVLAALSGCSSEDADSADAPSGSGAFPVRVDHRFGTTEIPAEPTRIVAVGLNDQDPLYALGTAPVAATTWFTDTVGHAWSREEAAGQTAEVLDTEVNFEAVAAQRPDLILATFSGITKNEYDLLSQIAPTIAGAPGYAAYQTPWQQQVRLIGRALGRERRAEELVAGVEQRFADVAASHPEWQGASAVFTSVYEGGQLSVYAPDNPATSSLKSLGFVIPAALNPFVDEGSFEVAQISAERLDLIDAQLVVSDAALEDLESAGLFALPTYQNLTAVREGRVIFPPEDVRDALSYRNVLSLPWALDRLVPSIEAAFDGDPATPVPS